MSEHVPVIDVHHHALLPQLTGGIDLGAVDIPSWSIDASVDFMDQIGIDVAVLTLSSPGVPFASLSDARAMARRINETLAGFVNRHPKRIAAFATLPLPHLDASLEELDYATRVLKLDGLGLMTNYGPYIGTNYYDPLYAALNDHVLPVHIHPTPPTLSSDQEFGLPPSLYEFTFETTRVAAQVVYNNLFNRYPNLKIILSHGGGTVPFLAKRLTFGPDITASLRETAPADIIAELGKFYFDLAMTGARFTLPALNELVGTGQLLYGSDYPFMPKSDIVESKEDAFGFSGYSASDLKRIASRNALTLLPRVAREILATA